MKTVWSLFVKMKIPIYQESLWQVELKFAYWFFRIFFFNFVYLISVCFGLRRGPLFEENFIQACFVPSLVEMGSVVLKLMCLCTSIFCYYLPLEKVVTFIFNKLEFDHPRMLRAKFGSNWPISFGVDSYTSSMYFLCI